MKTCIILLALILFVYGGVIKDVDEEELKEVLKIIEETEKNLVENGDTESDVDEKDYPYEAFMNDPLFISGLKCRIKCRLYGVCVKVAERIKNKILRELALKGCSRVKGGCSC